MLKIQEIREIIKLIDQSSIEKFTYETESSKITLKKGSSAPVVAPVQEAIVQPAPVVEKVTPVVEQVTQQEAAPVVEEKVEIDETLHAITSPMVGTFYKASSPEADAYVKIGDKVSAESIVCIVEAMKLFNEIEAEVTGEIVEILVEDGQLVEYGQPLFHVKID